MCVLKCYNYLDFLLSFLSLNQCKECDISDFVTTFLHDKHVTYVHGIKSMLLYLTIYLNLVFKVNPYLCTAMSDEVWSHHTIHINVQ